MYIVNYILMKDRLTSYLKSAYDIGYLAALALP